MCGSGTLLIEGALMAADVAPGLQRHGARAADALARFDTAAWQRWSTKHAQRAATRPRRAAPRILRQRRRPRRILRRRARQRRRSPGVGDLLDLRPTPIETLRARPTSARAASSSAIRRTTRASPPIPRCIARSATRCDATRRNGARACCAATTNSPAPPACARARRYQLFNGAIECTLIVCDPVAPPQRAVACAAAGVVRRRADGRQPPAQEPEEA